MKMWQLPLMPLPVCKTGKGEPSHANASTTFSPLCLLETVADNKKKWDHLKEVGFLFQTGCSVTQWDNEYYTSEVHPAGAFIRFIIY